jgi:biopolymer transport protein ExbB
MKYLLVLVLFAAGAVVLAQPPGDASTGAERRADTQAVTEDETAAGDSDAAEPAEKKKETKEAGQGGEGEESTFAEEADEGVTEPELPPWRAVLDDMLGTGAMGLLIEGGIFMWPILILGIVATGVIIERCRSLMMLSTDFSALRSEVADLLRSDRVEEALHLCDTQQGPVPAVLAAGVRQFLVLRQLNYDPGRIEDNVVKAMEDYSVHVVAALERHLPILATVSAVAPMLGFLGTVQGMIIAFDDIIRLMGETNIVVAAAAGIKTALLTTCFGLIVGIPAYLAYNYFTSVINRYVLDVEESASELMETVTLQMTLAEREAERVTAAPEVP